MSELAGFTPQKNPASRRSFSPSPHPAFPMNTSLLFLVRRDPVFQLTAHLAAGIAALVFIASFATPKETRLSSSAHPAMTVTVASPVAGANAQ